jgi:hypothetical protein
VDDAGYPRAQLGRVVLQFGPVSESGWHFGPLPRLVVVAASPAGSSCPSSPGPARPARIIRITSTAARQPTATRLASGSSCHSGTGPGRTLTTGARQSLGAFRTVLARLAAALPQPAHGRSQRQQAVNPDNRDIPPVIAVYAGIPAFPLSAASASSSSSAPSPPVTTTRAHLPGHHRRRLDQHASG